MTAETEINILADAFDMWFAEQKLPEELRGLMFRAYCEAWIDGMRRGYGDASKSANETFKAACDAAFGPKP